MRFTGAVLVVPVFTCLLGAGSLLSASAAALDACFGDANGQLNAFNACYQSNFLNYDEAACNNQLQSDIYTRSIVSECPVGEGLLGVCRFEFPSPAGALTDLYYYVDPNQVPPPGGLFQFAENECVNAGNTFFPGNTAPGLPGINLVDPPLTSGDPGSVSCGLESSTVTNGDQLLASCTALDANVRAEADVRNASVRLFASAPPPAGFAEFAAASGQVVDLITITSGFDANGEARGSFNVDLSGMMDPAAGNRSQALFRAVIFYPDRRRPPCIDDPVGCDLNSGNYDYAELVFQVDGGQVLTFPFQTLGGSVQVTSENPNDLRGALSIPWTATVDNPAFFVAVYGAALTPPGSPGIADFFNTAKGGFKGPAGFTYSGKRGLAATGANAEQPTAPVRVSGSIRNIDGRDITALVLASGRFQFSNQPVGRYNLEQLPREQDGGVRRQIYAAGFVPKIEVVRGSTAEPVTLASSGQCPNFNPVSMPAARPQSAGQRHRVSGRVFVQNSAEPIRAMVLINGQFDFADANGNYEVEFPLDNQGQFTRQVYASGFAPSIEKYDATTTSLDVRLARAAQCN